MTREGAYRKIGIRLGHHFTYLGFECMITDSPEVLVRNVILGDWTISSYGRLRLEGLMKDENIREVYRLKPKYWHHCAADPAEIEDLIERSQKGEMDSMR